MSSALPELQEDPELQELRALRALPESKPVEECSTGDVASVEPRPWVQSHVSVLETESLALPQAGLFSSASGPLQQAASTLTHASKVGGSESQVPVEVPGREEQG